MLKGSSNIVKIYYPELNQEELIKKIKRGKKNFKVLIPKKVML